MKPKSNERQEMIAQRIARELKGPLVVNLGIGIPTLIPRFLTDGQIFFQTENGMLGVKEVDENDIDPNIVDAGKKFIGEDIGASYFHSADSFAMIRGGHIDVAVLGALQVDEQGRVANWAVPGSNIIGVGGAMDLLEGAKRIIVSMMHVAKDGSPKIVDQCTYPLTSLRRVDMIVTDLAVFQVSDQGLVLTELMPGASLEEVREKTSARFLVDLKG